MSVKTTYTLKETDWTKKKSSPRGSPYWSPIFNQMDKE